jgi:epoxyqueuosine reductase QueG
VNRLFAAFDDGVCVPAASLPAAAARYPEARSLWVLVKAHTPYSLSAWGETTLSIASHYPAYQQGYLAVNALAEALQKNGQKAWVDFSFSQKPLAQQLGLGWIGKQTLLHHPVYGSYICLYTLLTEKEGEYTPVRSPLPPLCGDCTACIEACPTGALTDGFHREKCIRNWQLNPVKTPPEIEPFIGKRLLGCDLCQRACPRNPRKTVLPPEALRRALLLPDEEALSRNLPELKRLIGRNIIRKDRLVDMLQRIWKGSCQE